MDAAKHTLSHSALLTLRDSPSPANGAQAAAKPHLTELRQQLLNPDAASAAALSAKYGDARPGEDREAIGRELAARQAIDLLGAEGAHPDEKEFVVLQLLIGDAGGFDKASVQAVARKLAALSATMARDGAPLARDRAIGLLQMMAAHYATNMRLALRESSRVMAACTCFRDEINQLAAQPHSQIRPDVIESLVKAFDGVANPPVASTPNASASLEVSPPPATHRQEVDTKHSRREAPPMTAAMPPIQAEAPHAQPHGDLVLQAARFVEGALKQDASATRNETGRLLATSGQPALEAMVDATLDRLAGTPAGDKGQRQTLAALAWSLGGRPAGSEDPMAALSLCSKFLDRMDTVEDGSARLALLASFGEAARGHGRQAVAALERAIGLRALTEETRHALMTAATKPRSLLAPWREPRVTRFQGLQACVQQALETHDAIGGSPTAASALGFLLAPQRLAALKNQPETFQAHASQVIGQIRTRAGITALQEARACLEAAQARQSSIPKELIASFQWVRTRLQERMNALENANSPERLAQEAQTVMPVAPRPGEARAKAIPAPVPGSSGPSEAEWREMFNDGVNDVPLFKPASSQSSPAKPPESNNPFDLPDEVLNKWARENPSGKEDSGNPFIDP